MTAMSIWPGSPSPLGATSNGNGVNFALFSEHATEVKLYLFDFARRRGRVAAHRAAREDQSGLARLSAGLIIGFLHERFTHVPQSNSSLPTRSASIQRAAGGVPFSPPPGNRSGLPDKAAIENLAIMTASPLNLTFLDASYPSAKCVSGDGGSIGRWVNSVEIGSVTGVVQ
jgi:hypothetical protein